MTFVGRETLCEAEEKLRVRYHCADCGLPRSITVAAIDLLVAPGG